MAKEKKARYIADFGLPEYDASMITDQKALADFFEATAAICGKPKEVSNWIMGDLMRLLKDEAVEAKDMIVRPEDLAKLIELCEKGTLNRKKAREIFAVVFKEPVDIGAYIKEHNLEQVSDDSVVLDAVAKVFAANPQSIADYKAGKVKAVGFLIGQTMRALAGKADPAVVNRIVNEEIKKV